MEVQKLPHMVTNIERSVILQHGGAIEVPTEREIFIVYNNLPVPDNLLVE